MKICIFPNCNTILRKEHRVEKFCSLHQRILNQNEIIYWNKKFYKESEYHKRMAYLRNKSKIKSKRKKLTKGTPLLGDEVRRLKEVITEKDIFGVDRL